MSEDPEMSEWFASPPHGRVIEILADVMMNLRDLPEFANDRSLISQGGSLWFPAYEACLSSFFVNARLAAEFLVLMPRKDYTAASYLPDWSPPAGPATRLERVWLMTSKHIVHLGKERLPTNPVGWQEEDTSYAGLMRITRDANSALGSFVTAYEAADGTFAQEFRDMHEGTRPFTVKQLRALRKGKGPHSSWLISALARATRP